MMVNNNKNGKYFLVRSESRWFADGYQAYKEIYYEGSDEPRYKHGDFLLLEPEKCEFTAFDDLNLEWNNLYQPYAPTLWEKIKFKLFKKPYPEEIRVNPKDDSIVIVDYSFDCNFCDVAEVNILSDGKCQWVTEMYTGLAPKRWAYLPKSCRK